MRRSASARGRVPRRASAALTELLRKVDFRPRHRIVLRIEISVAEAIRDGARKRQADLVVVGTHGRPGPRKFLLGSVAEEVLRASEIDVLVVPLAGVLADGASPEIT